MGGGLKLLAAGLSCLVLFGSCGGDSGAGSFPDDCVLPTPDADVVPSQVPEQFLLPDTQVRRVSDEGGVDVYALNIPYGVTEAYDLYLAQLTEPDYEVVSVDNEGFEAEIYLRETATDRLLAIQIRQPRCTEASAVFVQVDNREK